MADCFQALTKIALARSGGQPAFVSTGSTTSTLIGNVNISGVLTSGTDVTQFASQTQAYASTISGNQFTFASGSIITAFTSTLSVGTILNFSAGGSIGTSLYLTGTLATPYASITSGSVGGLVIGSVSASTVAGNFGSLSTLTVGTILNLNFAGTLGTNLTLLGTIVAPTGSITKTSYAATLTVGTILNFLQGQTVSTSGTIAGTFASNTVVFPGSGSFTGTLSAQNLIVGTLTTLPLSGTVATSIAGPVTILNGVNDNFRMLSALDGGMGSATSRSIALGQNNSNGNEAELGFYFVGSNSSLNSMQLGLYGKQIMTLQNSGNVGVNSSSPNYLFDAAGSMRTGTLTNTSIGTNAGLVICHSLTSFPVSSATPALIDFNFTGPSQGNTTSANTGPSPGGRLAVNDSNWGVDWRWQSKIQGTVTNTLSERLTILGNGNVGIANSSPAYSLDINGSARLTGSLTVNPTSTGGALLIANPSLASGSQNYLMLGSTTSVVGGAAYLNYFAGGLGTANSSWGFFWDV